MPSGSGPGFNLKPICVSTYIHARGSIDEVDLNGIARTFLGYKLSTIGALLTVPALAAWYSDALVIPDKPWQLADYTVDIAALTPKWPAFVLGTTLLATLTLRWALNKLGPTRIYAVLPRYFSSIDLSIRAFSEMRAARTYTAAYTRGNVRRKHTALVRQTAWIIAGETAVISGRKRSQRADDEVSLLSRLLLWGADEPGSAHRRDVCLAAIGTYLRSMRAGSPWPPSLTDLTASHRDAPSRSDELPPLTPPRTAGYLLYRMSRSALLISITGGLVVLVFDKGFDILFP